MLKKNTLIVALIAALPALAQETAPQQPGPRAPHWGAAGEMPGRKGREDFHKQMLEKFDADKDGQLSETEKEAMKADMEKHRAEGKNRPGVRGDRNPKGPHGERPEGMRPEGKQRPEGMQRPSREDMQKKMLEKFDADKDGQLSDAEKEAMKAARPQRGGKGQGKGRGPKGPRGNKRGEATQGADVPATLPL